VELGEECDALGVPRLRTRMYFSDRDVQSVRRAMEHIDKHLRAHGVGHLEYLYDDVESAVYTHLGANAGYHQTGTTRMSASPDDGVVTPDLAIHGMEDLFVASTSVFPTSSQANPTLTGVAFAVRLADTLNAQLDHPRRGAASAPLRGAHAR
jgi:choline dehydrogenase-like flavoprotein